MADSHGLRFLIIFRETLVFPDSREKLDPRESW